MDTKINKELKYLLNDLTKERDTLLEITWTCKLNL